MSYDLPCIVMLLGHVPAQGAVADRQRHGILPSIMSRCENHQIHPAAPSCTSTGCLAPHVTRHGVLVDVVRRGRSPDRRKRRGQERGRAGAGQAGPSAGGGRRGGHLPGVRRPAGGRSARKWCVTSWRFAASASSISAPCTALAPSFCPSPSTWSSTWKSGTPRQGVRPAGPDGRDGQHSGRKGSLSGHAREAGPESGHHHRGGGPRT